MIIDNIVNKDINGNAANVNEKSIYNNLTATKSSSKEAVKVSSSNSVDMSDTVYSKPLNSNETVADELMQDGAMFQNIAAYCVTLIIYQLVGVALGEVVFGPATVVAGILLIGVLYLLFRKDPNRETKNVRVPGQA